MVERLGRLVRAEAEDEPARQRGPRPRAQLAAEQVRAPGRERGRRQRQHVVGRNRPDGRRQRPGQQRRPGDRARPGEVPAVGRVDEVRQQRVEAVLDRVRPPGERPREARLIGPVRADDAAAALAQHPAAEQREREQRIARERGERAATREPVSEAEDALRAIGDHRAQQGSRRDGRRRSACAPPVSSASMFCAIWPIMRRATSCITPRPICATRPVTSMSADDASRASRRPRARSRPFAASPAPCPGRAPRRPSRASSRCAPPGRSR